MRREKGTEVDVEVRRALDALQVRAEPIAYDWSIHERRESIRRTNELIAANFPAGGPLVISDIEALGICMFRPQACDANDDRVIIYVHGGGFIGGSVDQARYRCAWMAKHLGVTVAAVPYRLAPEWPFPAAHDDVLDFIHQIWARRADLGLAMAPMGIWGDSAGGCLVAGALLALGGQASHHFAFALLSQPALDDRTVHRPSSIPESSLTWSSTDNVRAWRSWLGPDTIQVSHFAAPARATSFVGFPPTYLDAGTLDLFQHEVEDLSERLRADGVKVEFRLWPDVPHAFDVIAPTSRVGKESWNAKFAFARRHIGRTGSIS